ncbi:MAG: YceD family protein [Devosia sp.]
MNAGLETMRIQDASIRLDSMPPAGRHLKLVMGATERVQLAGVLGISEVQNLQVSLHAVKFRGGMRVTGRLVAAIVQPSVVTLEPVRQEIEEPIDRIFLPGGGKPHAAAANAEIFVDIEGEDIPDHFEGPEADLSALIIETLALAIDPYPRAEGESVDLLGLPRTDLDDSPFASLESLKKPGDKG